MKYYNYILIFIIFYLLLVFRCRHHEKFETTIKKKRLATGKDNLKAMAYATKQICLNHGYGYDSVEDDEDSPGMCKHISKKTCIKDHPGYILNPADLEKLEQYKNSPCTQQLDSFQPLKTEVGEWLIATEEDKKKYLKIKENVDKLSKIVEKNKNKLNYTKLWKEKVKLLRAERDKDDRCQFSDQEFKRWCLRQRLKYTPYKDGMGKCEITESFCKSKIMDWDPHNRECVKKDKAAEYMFGATMVRGIQAGSSSDDVWECKESPCFGDEWCAGAGICKPITNPGQSCWSGHNESCWCQSTCSTPFNTQAIEEVGMIIGAVVLVVAVMALAVFTAGASLSLLPAIGAALLGTVVGMGAGMMGARAAQLSTESARCGAGKDGVNLPGGKNGDKNYLALGQGGCCDWYHCPPEYYCPVGNYPCRPAKDPGGTCLAGQSSWCKGESTCKLTSYGIGASVGGALTTVTPLGVLIVGATAAAAAADNASFAVCTAGKDGINPPGKNYKTIKVNKNPEKANPRIENMMKSYSESEDVVFDKDFKKFQGMIRPPKKKDPNLKQVVSFDNGDEHYISLNEPGCTDTLPCPPGYYCSGSSGDHCQKAKPPGSYCLAHQDNWCKGNSHCMSNSRCSCGRDGINAPGYLYYKDENGINITIDKTGKKIEPLYDNGNEHYTCINSTNCNAVNPTPPGYYCPSAFNTPSKAKFPGSTCLAGQSSWCVGNSKCLMTLNGGQCSAGEDGINPPGELRKQDIVKNENIITESYKHNGHNLIIRYDKRFIGENTLINKQVGNDSFIHKDEKGCAAGATCPSHVKIKDSSPETTHTYCKAAWWKCQNPKEAGSSCLLSNWCKQKRCKGGYCSTKLGNGWFIPIDGTCTVATDDCEPDTYCKAGLDLGTCTFGKPD
jgi:hypothetical protein